MSFDERFSQLQFVKQKLHFGFILNINRGTSKNSATAESFVFSSPTHFAVIHRHIIHANFYVI